MRDKTKSWEMDRGANSPFHPEGRQETEQHLLDEKQLSVDISKLQGAKLRIIMKLSNL